MKKRLFITLALASAGSLTLPGVPAWAQEKASTLDAIRKRGAIRVGVSTFVPWAMRNKKGELIGYEIDIAKRLAKDLNVDIEFVPTAWDGIIPALAARKFDVIIGGMSPTPERELAIAFTHPDSRAGTGAVANSALAKGKTTLEDFNQPDVVIATRRGITAVALLKEKTPKAKLVLFDDDAQAILEVVSGRAHLYVGSEPKPTYVQLDNPGVTFKPFDKLLIETTEAMGLRKGDPQLLKVLNDWIDARTKDGFLAERRQYWFGSRQWRDQVPETPAKS